MSSSDPATAAAAMDTAAPAAATAASAAEHRRSSRSRSRERSSRKDAKKSSKRSSRSRSPRSRSPRKRSPSRSRSRSRDRERRKKHRRRSRSASSSSSSSSSDSSSSSSDNDSSSADDRRSKKHHKSRKDSKRSKSSKKDSKKSKRSKKDKKKSKKKKSSSKDGAEEAQTTGSLTQMSWGAHGILQSSDVYSKAQEFHAWCMEVKHASRENLSKREEKELFAEYAEDFNTSTLPHEKYYDLDKWERANQRHSGAVDDLHGMNDEDRLRIERQRAKASTAAAHEDARIHMMKALMAKERESKSEAWLEIEKRQRASLQQSTFESIAKKREQDKKDQEALEKEKQRLGKR